METNLNKNIYSEKVIWQGRVVFFVILIFLSIPYFTQKDYFGILDYANLPFHEAGHFALFWAGEFICFLGGTLGQLAFPVGLSIYFYLKKETFASLFCIWWTSENFYNIGRYMKDAKYQLLPLFGGGEHDWVFLFSRLNLMKRCEEIGIFTQFVGGFFMFLTILGMCYYLFKMFLINKNKGELQGE